jgi:hypothetical protein
LLLLVSFNRGGIDSTVPSLSLNTLLLKFIR